MQMDSGKLRHTIIDSRYGQAIKSTTSPLLVKTVALVFALGMGGASSANIQVSAQVLAKKLAPPRPSTVPTAPLTQIPLDWMMPMLPEVTFRNGELTIVAPNSTLGDILRCVGDQTGAAVDAPVANDGVVTRLGPGPARRVMAELLNGSGYNYALLGSSADANTLTRIVLLNKGYDESASGNQQPGTGELQTHQQQAPPDLPAKSYGLEVKPPLAGTQGMLETLDQP